MLIEETLDDDLMSHEVERVCSEGLVSRSTSDDSRGADSVKFVWSEGSIWREDGPVERDDTDGQERGLGANAGLGEFRSMASEMIIPT